MEAVTAVAIGHNRFKCTALRLNIASSVYHHHHHCHHHHHHPLKAVLLNTKKQKKKQLNSAIQTGLNYSGTLEMG